MEAKVKKTNFTDRDLENALYILKKDKEEDSFNKSKIFAINQGKQYLISYATKMISKVMESLMEILVKKLAFEDTAENREWLWQIFEIKENQDCFGYSFIYQAIDYALFCRRMAESPNDTISAVLNIDEIEIIQDSASKMFYYAKEYLNMNYFYFSEDNRYKNILNSIASLPSDMVNAFLESVKTYIKVIQRKGQI